MTQEDKELLLTDLCGRLPYGVIVDIKYNKEHGSSDRLRICSEGSLILNTDLIGLYIEEEIHLKPYLRPMSSMTEEERIESLEFAGEDDYGRLASYNENIPKYIDWLNAHHFDYRDLISKGLALEMPKDMYTIY